MDRQKLIEGILTLCAASEFDAASKRYSDLSDDELVQMHAELNEFAAFGKRIKETLPHALPETLKEIREHANASMQASRTASAKWKLGHG